MHSRKANIIIVVVMAVILLAMVGIILGVVLSVEPEVPSEESTQDQGETNEIPSISDESDLIDPPEINPEHTDDESENTKTETGDIHLDVGEPNDTNKNNDPEIDDFVVIPGVKEGEE